MYDGNGDRTVDKKEFIGFIRKREQALWTAFQTLDLDKNGVLTPDEALKAVRKLGLKADERDASQMIKMLDANNDGVVSFDEFRAYLALLPAAQLRENVGWNWLAAASDRQVEMPSNQPFKQLLSGALGGALSRTLVAPLDRAVTMMQADSGKLKLTAAFKDVVSKVSASQYRRRSISVVCVFFFFFAHIRGASRNKKKYKKNAKLGVLRFFM